MTEKKEFNVKVNSYIVACVKMGKAIIITAENCEECKHHGSIIHIGKPILDARGTVLGREDVEVKAFEMNTELNKEGVMDKYSIFCNFPRILGTSVLGHIKQGGE